MGGVYRQDFAHTRLQGGFFNMPQDRADPELRRQKALMIAALGLEPPAFHHFKRLARQGEVHQSRSGGPSGPEALTPLGGSSGSRETSSSASKSSDGARSNAK
ncbi:unnamed protein product [Symbiodinium natans]|uniref:Uncharacterized protein n=1 Tax=Symbiodinium natans TaxID=878477 RepID=A0A812M2W7_9DINO|nr:unnamed protein product [Symbiodinium natans]